MGIAVPAEPGGSVATASCLGRWQIAPRVILAVGRVSAHNLLGSNLPVGKLIQQIHQLPGTEIPVKVTYHPAYLLRSPAAKAIAWQDLKLLHRMLK